MELKWVQVIGTRIFLRGNSVLKLSKSTPIQPGIHPRVTINPIPEFRYSTTQPSKELRGSFLPGPILPWVDRVRLILSENPKWRSNFWYLLSDHSPRPNSRKGVTFNRIGIAGQRINIPKCIMTDLFYTITICH